jgi:hypothetical protein
MIASNDLLQHHHWTQDNRGGGGGIMILLLPYPPRHQPTKFILPFLPSSTVRAHTRAQCEHSAAYCSSRNGEGKTTKTMSMAEVAAWHWAQGLRPHTQDTAVYICGMGGCGGTSGTGGAEATGEEHQLGDRHKVYGIDA